MALDVKLISQENLTDDQYVREDCSSIKKIFVLHHTAGGASAINAINGWQKTSERVATAFVIAGKPSKNDTHKDGQIYQAFGSKYWAYHIYFAQKVNQIPDKYKKSSLDQKIAKESIGVEICNWGFLTKGDDGVFRTYVNTIVPAEEVVEFANPYRGHKYYHAYTDAQISSLKDLIVHICDKYNISKKFNSDMFEISINALDGVGGIWSHTSYRSDKTDLNPQPKLIQMLKDVEQGNFKIIIV